MPFSSKYQFDYSTKKFLIDITILGTGEGHISTISYTPSATYPDSIYFQRNITIDGTNFKKETFKNFSKSQDDVPNTITDSKGSIAFYVVLYGLTDQFVSVFSDVVYLGSLPIDITN